MATPDTHNNNSARTVLLNANESPFDLPAGIKREILAAAAGLPFNRYDAGLMAALREEITAYVRESAGEAARDGEADGAGTITGDNIVFGNGSDELIRMAVEAFASAGDRVAMLRPTFEMYRRAAAALGRRPEMVELTVDRDRWVADDERLVEACRGAAAVIICRPNNPTGTVVAAGTIERILRETAAVVVIDEAYFEFSGLTLAGWVPSHERLVVLRTMSKLFSVAGLRLGYAVAPVALAKRLEAARLPFNLSTFTQLAATVVMRHRAEFAPLRESLRREVARLAEELARRPGVTVYPGGTNFLLFRTPWPADELHARLSEQGVVVRRFANEPMLAQCLRVNAGARPEGDAFLRALDRVVRGSE